MCTNTAGTRWLRGIYGQYFAVTVYGDKTNIWKSTSGTHMIVGISKVTHCLLLPCIKVYRSRFIVSEEEPNISHVSSYNKITAHSLKTHDILRLLVELVVVLCIPFGYWLYASCFSLIHLVNNLALSCLSAFHVEGVGVRHAALITTKSEMCVKLVLKWHLNQNLSDVRKLNQEVVTNLSCPAAVLYHGCCEPGLQGPELGHIKAHLEDHLLSKW